MKLKLLVIPALCLALVTAACGLAQWIKAAQEVLPVVLPMITNLVTATSLLENKTVSPQDLQTINSITGQVSSDLNLASTLISTYQSSPNATTEQKIDDALADANTNLNALLPALHITDEATVEKIHEIVTLVTQEVESIQALIPIVQSSQSLTEAEAQQTGFIRAKDLKKIYNGIVSQSTGNSLVDSAFSSTSMK